MHTRGRAATRRTGFWGLDAPVGRPCEAPDRGAAAGGGRRDQAAHLDSSGAGLRAAAGPLPAGSAPLAGFLAGRSWPPAAGRFFLTSAGFAILPGEALLLLIDVTLCNGLLCGGA
jgi:hypothetical protein